MAFFKSTLITFLSSVFRSSISLLISIVISRLLGPVGNGIVGVANNFLFFTTLILGFGMSTASTYFAAQNRKSIGKLVGNNIIISFLSLIPLIPFYILNDHFHFAFLKGLNNQILILLLIIVPLSNLSLALVSIFLGLQYIGQYNKLSLWDRMLNFILLAVLLFFWRTPTAAIVATFLETALLCGLEIAVLRRRHRLYIKTNVKLLGRMLNYGVRAQISNVIQMINLRLDVFVINYYLPISQVGIYSIAVSLAETLWKITGAVSIMALPMASASRDKKQMSNFLNTVTRISVILIILMSLLLGVLCKPVVWFLFGSKYTSAAMALILLLPGISVFSIANILANYLAGVGLLNQNIISAAISCASTIILDLVLIPRHGIDGASVATSISYGIYALVTIMFYQNYTKSRFRDMLLARRSDLSLVITTITSKSHR